MDYRHKIDFAVKLLRAIPDDGPIEVSYSGGKDSDVILELAKMAGINYRAIYKNTTIDPPGTLKHCREMGAEIIQPKQAFSQLVQQRGLPNRWRRFCCSELKEYKVLDRAIQGIRREESTKRAARYKEPEFCRAYPGKEKVRIYLPILEWSLEDVARFIDERGIKCAPVYYDESGCFHPERRLGCLCCPLQNMKARQREFQKYPKIARLYLKAGAVWMQNINGKTKEKFDGNIYNAFFCNVFFDSYEQYSLAVSGGMFPEQAIDTKKYLEEFLGIDLTF